jgi:hypothetical protein
MILCSPKDVNVSASARTRADLVSTIVVAAFGLFTFLFGFWALVDTSSFYDEIASFEPYNRHFLHDVGAFQMGLGACLLFALVWRGDAVLAVLGGAVVGAVAHEIAHVADDGLGGRSSDLWTLGIIAIVLTATFLWRLWVRYQSESV